MDGYLEDIHCILLSFEGVGGGKALTFLTMKVGPRISL